MTELGKMERSAIKAVAKHFSATWQEGENPPDAFVTIEGRRVAVEIAVMDHDETKHDVVRKSVPIFRHHDLSGRGAGPTGARTPRLRDDRVAQRILRNLEDAMEARIPDGRALIVTLGAPIKVPNQLLAALTERLLSHVENGAEDHDEMMAVLGNRVRFRVLGDGSAWTSKVIGFVFSGDPSPHALAEAMGSLRQQIAARTGTGARHGYAGDRWLVLAGGDRIADGKTYRRALSRLSVPDTFAKVLMVSDGDRVDALAG